jgi:hypothetical protein
MNVAKSSIGAIGLIDLIAAAARAIEECPSDIWFPVAFT